MSRLVRLGIAKDHESPENPGALDRRVAMLPAEVKVLVAHGLKVAVEADAGAGVGCSDADYKAAGAQIEPREALYGGKDLLLKLKGVALEDIKLIDRDCVLFCMAHFHSFPERAQALDAAGVQVVAMEEVLFSPKEIDDELVLGKGAMRAVLDAHPLAVSELDVTFVGYSDLLVGALRRAGNRRPRSLRLVQPAIDFLELPAPSPSSVVVFDSAANLGKSAERSDLLTRLREGGALIVDVQTFKAEHPEEVESYWDSHPRFEFGGRRVQCLHETGMAGAGYGLSLLAEQSTRRAEEVKACVFGYGNVGMGAIHRCFAAGVPMIDILTMATTAKDKIEPYLARADLIVNGAEQPRALRGKNYLLTRRHTEEVLHKGSVVIDLVGGSAVNRSAVEDVVECTFLTDPHFVRAGVTFSSLWGWPMLGMMAESAKRYSGQVLEILLEDGGLLEGLDAVSPGIARAIVSGPHHSPG